MIWNFIYAFVLTYYRSSSTLVAFDLLLHELLPFAKISFSGLFSVIFRHIDLKFHMWILLDIIQIKFDFYVWPACTPDIFFCLNLVFRTFLCCLARYWHQIWGMNLYWHNTENFSLLYPFMYSFWSYASLKFVGAVRGHVLLQQYWSNTYNMLVWSRIGRKVN